MTRGRAGIRRDSVASMRISVVLPAPFGPEDREDHAARHVEVDAVDGTHVAKLLDQPAGLDGKVVRVHFCSWKGCHVNAVEEGCAAKFRTVQNLAPSDCNPIRVWIVSTLRTPRSRRFNGDPDMSSSNFARPVARGCLDDSHPLRRAAWPSATFALLVGKVSADTDMNTSIVVLAVDSHGKVAHRVFLESKRAFQMPLAPGSYKLYAFADANRDGRRGADEAVSVMYTLATPVRAGEMLELPAFDIR